MATTDPFDEMVTADPTLAALGDTETPAPAGQPDKASVGTMIGWAVGSTGTGTLLGVVNALYLKYVVDELLLSAALAGANYYRHPVFRCGTRSIHGIVE